VNIGSIYSDYIVRKKQGASKQLISTIVDILGVNIDRESRPILMDVGGAGHLKEPWSVLLPEYIQKICFDPDDGSIPQEGLLQKYPFCLSDTNQIKILNIAHDPRASSLHEWDDEFLQRFGKEHYRIVKRVPVQCIVGDEIVQEDIDFVDINTEGHDYWVLHGIRDILKKRVYLLRIEFEFFSVYKGQGTFGDIEKFMHNLGYELVSLDMIDYAKENSSIGLSGKGMLLWGKMMWIRKSNFFFEVIEGHTNPRVKFLKALIGNCLLVLPSHSFKLLITASKKGIITDDEYNEIIHSIEQFYKENSFNKIKLFFEFPWLILRELVRRFR